ncbi:MAG: helix-turn-helix domain-containing protein [Dermatophilaceae bacterium]
MNIQAAGSERGTRDRVLAAITARGPISASALGRELALTPAAVRRHLDALEADGAIVERESSFELVHSARTWSAGSAVGCRTGGPGLAARRLRRPRGRCPALSARASRGEAVAEFARRRAERLKSRYAGQLAAVDSTPTAKAQALVDALSRDGFAATARPVAVGGLTGIQVCQGHCPVRHVATEFPELCQAETDAFSRLLGVHVQRLSTLAAGQHVCTTFVPTAPVSEPGEIHASASPSTSSSPKGLLA